MRLSRASAWLGGAFGLYLVVTVARVHPYTLDYYAEHVGGPKTVAARRWFEVGWWGEGISEAVDFVNAHAAPDAKVYRLLQPVHVNWLRHDLWAETPPGAADWIIVNDAGQVAAPLYGLRRLTLPAHLVLVHDV